MEEDELFRKITLYSGNPGNNKMDDMNPLKVGDLEFERVLSFNYLGCIIRNKAAPNSKIHQRIQKGNRAYFSNRGSLTSKRLSKRTKIRIYKSLIRPVVTETLTFTKQEEENLRFERKILRNILSPIKENNQYRMRMNFELKQELGNEDIINFI